MIFSFGLFAFGVMDDLAPNPLSMSKVGSVEAPMSSVKNPSSFHTGRLILASDSMVPEEVNIEPTLIHKYAPMFLQKLLAKYQLLVLLPTGSTNYAVPTANSSLSKSPSVSTDEPFIANADNWSGSADGSVGNVFAFMKPVKIQTERDSVKHPNETGIFLSLFVSNGSTVLGELQALGA
jgi:hypothetical protein